MFKTILLCTDGSPGAGVAAETAIWLAHKLGSRIRALCVTDIRILEGPLLADVSGAIGAQPYPSLLPQVKEVQTAKARSILDAAAESCRQRGVPCETVHEIGSLVHTMLEQERSADLVVLGQRGEHAAWHRGVLGTCVERVVRASAKPCLVTTDQFRQPRHLLIAHDGSEQSTLALHRGLNLAVALGARVTLVTACPQEQADPASQALQQAHDLASARHLKTHAQLVHANAETAILQLADEVGADLIIMGAYGHTRIREWILGSTTSHVLRETQIPVLLSRET